MGRRRFKIRKLKIARKIPSKASATAAASSAVPPPPPPPWIELPGDVTANILGRLCTEEILRSAQSVCTTWWKVCQDPAMWRVINLSCFNPEHEEQYTTMCRRAVDRSQGQLIDLHLDCFGDGGLIEYIAERSSNLKRLTLVLCHEISGDCFAEAAKKFPRLEELHLTIAPRVWVMALDITNIGISCPNLESFSFSGRSLWTQDDMLEGIDLAIGKSMPNLRHLKLFANCVLDPGLEAILDGCPCLESLNIQECYGLDLGGDVVKRCRDRIKDLKLPTYSISDSDEYDDYSDVDDYGDCYDYDDYRSVNHYSSFDFEAYDGFNDFW